MIKREIIVRDRKHAAENYITKALVGISAYLRTHVYCGRPFMRVPFIRLSIYLCCSE